MKLQFALCSVLIVLAEVPAVTAESYPFDKETWEMQGTEAEIVDYLGQTAMRLKGGMASPKDVIMTNGIIEYDQAIAEIRGFSGAMFRAQDRLNYEHFYLRPHQSGNPDANQYTPVFNGVAGWQLYHGSDYSTAVEYKFDQWMHIKIVFAAERADIYIDSDEPTLQVRNLKMDVQSGRVGLNSAGFSAVHFANFNATPLADDYQLAPVPEDAAVEQQNNNANRTVSTWQVSTAFDQASLKNTYQLDDSHKTGLTWTRLQAEPGGVTNLARIQGPSPESNTVFARLVISSEKPQTMGLSFGYSDAVQVFVNDVLVYQGHNTYESRDYRYLGTIGLFDKVYLPLKRGDNEIWFAVSEAFGGWGILAQLDESEGITIKQ